VAWLYSFFSLGARWGWVVSAMPGPICAQDINPVPIVQEAEWDAGSVQMWKISPLPGFDPRTIQPLVSSYTDYTVLVHEPHMPDSDNTVGRHCVCMCKHFCVSYIRVQCSNPPELPALVAVAQAGYFCVSYKDS
jgi:hypothetical protein